MNVVGFENILQSDDLIGLGIEADAKRRELHPGGIVTYCLEQHECIRLVYNGSLPNFDEFGSAAGAKAITPVCAAGITGAEYLKFLAACRLCLPVEHIELDAAWSGLKVAQLALRFGADDFGSIGSSKTKPSSTVTEEEVRRLIREAGFIPKRRDSLYRCLSTD